MYESFATVWERVADAIPDAPAVVQGERHITYREVLSLGLEVMDTTAISLCMDNKLPIVVFDLTRAGNIKRIVLGEPVGSIVSAEKGG